MKIYMGRCQTYLVFIIILVAQMVESSAHIAEFRNCHPKFCNSDSVWFYVQHNLIWSFRLLGEYVPDPQQPCTLKFTCEGHETCQAVSLRMYDHLMQLFKIPQTQLICYQLSELPAYTVSIFLHGRKHLDPHCLQYKMSENLDCFSWTCSISHDVVYSVVSGVYCYSFLVCFFSDLQLLFFWVLSDLLIWWYFGLLI